MATGSFEDLARIRKFSLHRTKALDISKRLATLRTGFLTYGSSYYLHLPSPLAVDQWHITDFVPVYSGGTVPEFNGIPFSEAFFSLQKKKRLSRRNGIAIDLM